MAVRSSRARSAVPAVVEGLTSGGHLMKRSGSTLSLGIVLVLAPVAARAADPPAHAYVGAEKCAKMCHSDTKTGDQYGKWLTTAHAKAYQNLGAEKAKELAKAKGIADPQKAPECLRCHVTGHGAPADKLAEAYKAEDGVTC